MLIQLKVTHTIITLMDGVVHQEPLPNILTNHSKKKVIHVMAKEFCEGCCYRYTCDGDLEKCCYLVGTKCIIDGENHERR